jgi:hypothetical protein
MDGRTLLKRYDQVLREAQFLRGRNRELEQELRVSGPALYRADQRIDRLEQRVERLGCPPTPRKPRRLARSFHKALVTQPSPL